MRTHTQLAIDIAERERGALAVGRKDIARELSLARAHVTRAAKLLGVDVSQFPRVAHGGTDLREAPRERATHDSHGRKIVEETRPGAA